ncbi:MAG TPA: sulfatase-like hydrolase/transferase [Solirubrobacterales bacterium]|nr:sulfatase-like hydrolase/transferase [Solirubrobacterales bacterium]
MDRFAQLSTHSRALTAARLAFAASLLALLCVIGLRAEGASAAATSAKQKPSFVVIQTDDQTLDQLYAEFTPVGGATIKAMPYTLELIAGKGVTFSRYYVSYPLCCPSRVSLLTGRYAHNHNVRGNVPPEGGYTGFSIRNAYSHNIATWLQGAGYRTIHVGKFLNGYGDEPFDNGRTVPPGWSAWHTVLNADTDHYFYGYTLNDNGSIDGPFGDSGSWETREYGAIDDFGCPFAPLNGQPCLYETDIFNRIATEELAGTSPEQPFYLQVDYTAPHGDFRKPAGPEPATRHYNTFAGAPFPHGPSEGFNEGNVNDKPRFIREASYLSPTDIHTYRIYYQKALESLRSVDEGVKQIVDTLGALHRLRNTYIIFTSDNGFFYGEHRLTGGKFLAYEPSTHLPFLMRGPGIKPGTETGQLASNVDIAPTVLELAGVTADKSIDGSSLYPYAHDSALRTRRPVLFESFVQTNDVEENGGGPASTPTPLATGASGGGPGVNSRPKSLPPQNENGAKRGASASIVAPPKNYYGIIYGPWKYIEWPDGEKELYDLTKDPYELNNKARDPNLFPIRGFLHNELVRLETCKGRVCQEVAPKLPLTKREQLKIKRQKEKEQREREQRQKEREQKAKHHQK